MAPSEGATLAGPRGATAPLVDGAERVARGGLLLPFRVAANLLRHCPIFLRNPQMRARGHRHEGSGIPLPSTMREKPRGPKSGYHLPRSRNNQQLKRQKLTTKKITSFRIFFLTPVGISEMMIW